MSKRISAKEFAANIEKMAPVEIDRELEALMKAYGINKPSKKGEISRLSWPVDKPLGIAYG